MIYYGISIEKKAKQESMDNDSSETRLSNNAQSAIERLNMSETDIIVGANPISVQNNQLIADDFTMAPFFEVSFDLYWTGQLESWSNMLNISNNKYSRVLAVVAAPAAWGNALHIRHDLPTRGNWGLDFVHNPNWGALSLPYNTWVNIKIRLEKIDSNTGSLSCKTNGVPNYIHNVWGPKWECAGQYDDCSIYFGGETAGNTPGAQIKNFTYLPIYYNN